MQFTVNSERSLETFLQQAEALWRENKFVRFDVKIGNTRTLPQNRSLHLFCEQIANELNARGLDKQIVLAQRPELAWTGDGVKEDLARPILSAITGNHSTAKAKTIDYLTFYDTLNRFLTDNFNVSVGWPSRD